MRSYQERKVFLAQGRNSADTTYHGVFQLIIAPSGKEMKGKWIGTSSKRNINIGNWEFKKIES